MKVKYRNQEVEIIVEKGCLTNLNQYLDKAKRYFVITDRNVHNLYYHYFKAFPNIDEYVIKPGENSKDMNIAQAIIKQMLAKNYDRKDMIIAFGGGVVGDLAGFVASFYKRGIAYINIPTTLIAQVDSAIGGKVAVNFEGYKNQIGTIYHPELILVDPNVLKTLDADELQSGMGEVVKYAILFDEEMYYQLLNNTYDPYEIIKKCIDNKVKITTIDEFDQGVRRLLNFGHTIGHAIEAKYHLPHGVSIGYGMYLETKNEKIKLVLEKLGFDFKHEFNDLYEYIKQDKKIHGSKITVVRVKDIGNAILEEGEISEYFCE